MQETRHLDAGAGDEVSDHEVRAVGDQRRQQRGVRPLRPGAVAGQGHERASLGDGDAAIDLVGDRQ